jgi:hypothetical protein
LQLKERFVPDATVQRPKRHRIWWGLCAAVVLLIVAMLPWEWSFIDDSALIGHLRWNMNAYGHFGGIAATIRNAAEWDLTTWGLFRPSYWLYQGVFYLLPVGPAHAVRVAMLALAVAGPIVEQLRRVESERGPAAIWCGAALLANGALWAGLWYPSLQELSGAAFIGLGLLAGAGRPGRLVACWTVAAWFKSPLAWALLALGLLLLRRRPAAGIVATLLGLGTLGAAAALARSGSYVAQNLTYGPHELAANLAKLAAAAGAAALVVLVGAMWLGATVAQAGAVPLALLAGGVGYAATLAPWRVGGYYPGPAVYLVTAGVLLLLTRFAAAERRRARAAAAGSALSAAVLLVSPVGDGIRSVVNTVQLRDCVLRLPSDASIGFDAGEGAIRLEQIAKAHDPGWRGRIATVEPGKATGWRQGKTVRDLGWYIRSGQQDLAERFDGPIVCHSITATVHRAG